MLGRDLPTTARQYAPPATHRKTEKEKDKLLMGEEGSG
jgi:hypothetical protein